jgi:nickel/cobalt transporter (NiCoT) family protein
MSALLDRLHGTFDAGERRRLAGLYAIIAAVNVVGWAMLVSAARQYPALLGLGALAFSFGLRHAFDADHISAIDNTTRKLLQQGKRPVGVGFFFSLGHSTVVLLIALALGFAAHAIVDGVVGEGGQLKEIGGLIGTTVSGAFLLLIGVLNLIVLLDIVGIYRRMQRGEYDRTTLEEHLITGGVLTRLFSKLFSLIGESWQMYPIGFLFGLGFDTASEVALLAISAGAASQGLPVYAVIALPMVFAGGMTLMDTTDGAFMAKAYSWAFSNPLRKLFYNLTMTGLSVFVALFVGVVELAQIVAQALGLEGGLWGALNALNLGSLGFIIVAGFVVCWAAALTLYKVRRVEERWAVRIQS